MKLKICSCGWLEKVETCPWCGKNWRQGVGWGIVTLSILVAIASPSPVPLIFLVPAVLLTRRGPTLKKRYAVLCGILVKLETGEPQPTAIPDGAISEYTARYREVKKQILDIEFEIWSNAAAVEAFHKRKNKLAKLAKDGSHLKETMRREHPHFSEWEVFDEQLTWVQNNATISTFSAAGTNSQSHS